MNGGGHPLYEQPWPEGEYRFFQLGHVVDDIVGAAREWTRTFGVGPFHVLPVRDQRLRYADEERTVSLQVAVTQAGPVQIELLQQHCDTPSIYRDWSDLEMSRVHQLATVTDDYDAKLRHFVDRGYEVVAQSVGELRVAYVDTVTRFGFYTEIVESSPQFLAQLRSISATCAAWDGSDPVRLLTRDGYRVPEGDQW